MIVNVDGRSGTVVSAAGRGTALKPDQPRTMSSVASQTVRRGHAFAAASRSTQSAAIHINVPVSVL